MVLNFNFSPLSSAFGRTAGGGWRFWDIWEWGEAQAYFPHPKGSTERLKCKCYRETGETIKYSQYRY
jgi:hypothetical protein